MLYKSLILPILQLINPEVSHFIAEKFFQFPFNKVINPVSYRSKLDGLQTNVLGITFIVFWFWSLIKKCITLKNTKNQHKIMSNWL